LTAYFADTTAIFEYHAGTGVVRDAARTALADRDATATSEAVEREWKRILVKAASEIIVGVEREPDLAATLARLGRGHGREVAQRLRALAMCVGTSDDLDRRELALRARQLVRHDIASRLSAVAGEVRRSSRCGLALESPRPQPDGSYVLKDTCRRREGICEHELRLEGEVVRWRNASQSLIASDNDAHRRMGRTAKEMAEKGELRTGRNCYGRTGDVAIALDCLPDEEMVTTDGSFETLGPAMGFAVRRLPTQ
jgi:hypothetical protein